MKPERMRELFESMNKVECEVIEYAINLYNASAAIHAYIES